MNKLLLTALGSSVLLAASGAFASDGTITITGQVTDSSCNIAVNGGTADYTVTLPTVSKDVLASDGAVAGASAISFSLSGCPASGAVRAYFEPTNVDPSTGNLLNNAASPADNVQVQVLNQSGTAIDLRDNSNNPFTNFIDDGSGTSGTADFTYSAQYIAVGGAAAAGQVDTALVYTLDYQ